VSIANRVYNVTPYLRYHPGGVAKLMLVAGKDGTDLFNKFHAWVNADSILGKCAIGTLLTDAEEAAYAEWEVEQAAKEAAEAAEDAAKEAAEAESGITQRSSGSGRRPSLSKPHELLEQYEHSYEAPDSQQLETVFRGARIATNPESPIAATGNSPRRKPSLSEHLESDSSASAQSLLMTSPPVRSNSIKIETPTSSTKRPSIPGGFTAAVQEASTLLDPNAVLYSGELSKQGHLVRLHCLHASKRYADPVLTNIVVLPCRNWKTRQFELRSFEIKYFDNHKVSGEVKLSTSRNECAIIVPGFERQFLDLWSYIIDGFSVLSRLVVLLVRGCSD
jgi:hypothetical protein